jgi:peptidoglycan/xylan/chitin deacetylase (PgdA/CDA1 family)
VSGRSGYESVLPVYASPRKTVSLYLAVKRFLYRLCKSLGLFRLSERLTRRGLRIICYHGFSLADESSFSGRTFIDPPTLERRMAFLKRNGFRVMGLEEALDLLARDAVPPRAVVITIDDGFDSVYSAARPVLERYGFPATVYVTTYYVLEQNPVFNLALQYLFWKTRASRLDLTGLGATWSGVRSIEREKEKRALLWELVRFGEERCDEAGRVRLARMLGERLGVDYDAIATSRILTMMTEAQIRDLSAAGIDVELHTHRHVFPLDRDRAVAEIRENRAALEPLVGRPLVHFCYPAGIWAKEHWPYLAETAMASAVTSDRGLNFASTPRYGLKRFGDNEQLSQIEFEADIYGFTELYRAVKRGLRFG